MFRVLYVITMLYVWFTFMILLGPLFLGMSLLVSGGNWSEFRKEFVHLASPKDFIRTR
jgi:hypothetical protein